MIHQDYIARIRYSNALPPPPNPPKLLDIPNTGLASGQYTTPAFSSRLAREQPLNIEADAELGMPLDLVGMPGVFDGDESSIQAPPQAPPVHPHDRLLLRPLATLGKPKIHEHSVSFLRRTEYISAVQTRPKIDPFLKPTPTALKRPEKRKAVPEPDKGTPAWIKRRIEKSFEVAAANLADRNKVKHPSKRNLKLVDALPLLPDLEAFPDSGAYVTVKFQTNPVATTEVYDTRLPSGIFKPIERSAAEENAFEAAMAAHERDPANNPKPSNMMNYDFFLAADVDTADRFRQCFDLDNPDHENPALYTVKDDQYGSGFRFPRVRAYETAKETEMDHETKYDDEVILAYHKDDSAQRAVYYYPIMQRSVIRSQRTKNIARTIGITTDEDEPHADELNVRVVVPDEELQGELERFGANPLGYLPEYNERGDHSEGAGEASPPPKNGGRTVSDEEQDAEGDEED